MSCRTRIATESSFISMPECVLGITPDVGASDWLFSSLPDRNVGLLAGLTGARLQAPAMAATGLLTHMVTTTDANDAECIAQQAADVSARLLAAPPADLEELLEVEAVRARTVAAAAGQTELRRWAAEADAAATAAAAVVPTEGAAAKLGAWADWTAGKMARGCPAALLVAFECSQTTFEGDTSARRAQALGTELVANQLLAARADFQEGVACAVGNKKGKAPMWSHSSLEEAACDPEIVQILEAVRSAEPLDLTR